MLMKSIFLALTSPPSSKFYRPFCEKAPAQASLREPKPADNRSLLSQQCPQARRECRRTFPLRRAPNRCRVRCPSSAQDAADTADVRRSRSRRGRFLSGCRLRRASQKIRERRNGIFHTRVDSDSEQLRLSGSRGLCRQCQSDRIVAVRPPVGADYKLPHMFFLSQKNLSFRQQDIIRTLYKLKYYTA